MALNNLGYLALEANELGAAGRWFSEAIAMAHERGDQRSEAFFLENMALAELEGGQPAKARDNFAASLRLSRRLGFVEVAATDLIGLAGVAASHGDDLRAARLLGGADRLLEQTGGQWDPVEARVRARTIEAIEHAVGRVLLDEGVEDGRQRDPEDVVNEALEDPLD